MRKTLVLAVLLTFVFGSAAIAGIPDPSRSGCEASGTGSNTCHYAFSVDATDQGMVRISERWNDMSDIEAHMQTPHMAKFMEAVVAIEPKSVDIKAFEVAKEVKLPG